MLYRTLAFTLFFASIVSSRGQQAFSRDLSLGETATEKSMPIESAWIDLRQTIAENSKPQSAPNWVESVTLGPAASVSPVSAKSVFRIRLRSPGDQYRVLMFRLFFDDNPKAKPQIIAWDESGSQVLRSSPLGSGLNLPTSETIMVPMLNITALDVEVPGDGSTIRGAYLDWMTSSEVVHPVNAQQHELIPQPFNASSPLRAPQSDTELFGTVTAPLATETIPMGPSIQQSASLQFGLEALPLLALVTFEVASPKVEAPPNIYLNGEDMGPATFVLPDLADPGYRGVMRSLVRQMEYHYTGWVRAQKLLPVSRLKVGTNDLIVVAGSGTAASAIRGTQIQLKYLWEKSDYLLKPELTYEKK